MTTRQTLTTGWRVRQAPPADIAAHNHLPWMPAQVPGHIHLDLMRAGVIPDPFVRLHERDVAWVDETDWIYETTFDVANPPPSHAYLVFHGLDTIAEITLNGHALGTTDNMFIPHEFPVGGQLKTGANHLEIMFRSARRIGRERQAAWNEAGQDTAPWHWDNWGERAFVRKAQYMYGWDWGPVLVSCGVWRPVELVAVPVARLRGWKHEVQFTGDDKAVVTVTAEIERAPGQENTPLELALVLTELSDMDGNALDDPLPPAITIAVPTGGGTTGTVQAALTIDSPRRWWPNGLNTDTMFDGSHPPLYTLQMTLTSADSAALDTAALDTRTARIGLRTIELIHEPDADGPGEGFKLRVNGQDIFMKGANWIPNDSFPSRLVNEAQVFVSLQDTVAMRLEAACNAGFNMLRVWGGGLYESERFYELCDAHGILVWQDFPYACSYYPDDTASQDAARTEATVAVRRLRNHPSLALWCGNNENQMMWDMDWTGHRPPHLLGDPLYHGILPSVVADEDPQTPYWPSSPWGGPAGQSNSEAFGDCHNWDVWHGRGDWTHYTENDARFCSEFGFASSCGLAAWDAVLAPEDRHPQSLAVRWHDKTRKGYDTYLDYIRLHFPDPQSLEDLVYFSQLNQAEALKFGVEHYRRRKGHCWGTLFWQLNDCWPVQSWAIIDFMGEPKAAYYACKKFYAPVLLSLRREGTQAHVHIVNDHRHAVEGALTLTLQTVDGHTLTQDIHTVQVRPNGAECAASVDLAPAETAQEDTFLHASFQPGTAGESVENILLLAEPKDLRRADPGLFVSVSNVDEWTLQITVTAQRFAPYVWLRRADNIPLELSDNFFHLRPGETRNVVIEKNDASLSAATLHALLVARTL